MRRRPVLAALVPLVAVACGSGDDDTDAAGGAPIRVVASFYPVAEAARQAGGDRVEVVNLTPAGTEPHDLELTPRQVDQLLDADVVLYLGQDFQPAVQGVVEGRDGTSVDLLDAVALERGTSVADDHDDDGGDDHAGDGGADEHPDEPGDAGDGGADGDTLDPHFWLDPAMMRDAVGRVEEALADEAPEHAGAFAANASRYEGVLDELDQEFATTLADCERRILVTSHAAFRYLAARYDLEQLPIAGLSPESEPDPRRLAELADLIADEGVTTVFYETLVAPDVAETVAREAGVDTAVLNPLEGLGEDAIDDGQDYVSVMRDNLDALAGALGCA